VRYRIEYTETALSDLRKLDARTARRVWERSQAFSEEPYPPGCERLKGPLRDYLKVRVGDRRIVYWVGSDCIHIVRVGRRSTIYKDLRRLQTNRPE
jgi:mRNA-degrading endonuclease RelE of RelBE toxin-antitoxin system